MTLLRARGELVQHPYPMPALISSALAWLAVWLWHVRGAGPSLGVGMIQIAVIVVLAALVPLFIARVEYGFLRGARSTLSGYVLVAGASSTVFALLTLIPAGELRLRWVLVLGAVPVLVHAALLVRVGGIDRASGAQLGVAAGSLSVLVGYFWWRHVPVPAGELVWSSADQRLYAQLAHGLVSGDLQESRYPPGLSMVLAPYTLLADSAAPEREIFDAANRLNMALIPTMMCVVAFGFAVIGRVGAQVAQLWSPGGKRLLVHAVPAVVASAYVLLPPSSILERNAGLVPRRLLGFVYSAEPFTYLYVAVALGLLAGLVNQPDRTWSPWMLGVASGLTISMRESNAFVVGLLFLLLLTFRGHRRRVAGAAAVLGALLLAQAGYFFHVYGKFVMPNRGVYSGERWREYAGVRYAWDEVAAPPQMSARYSRTNLADIVAWYGPILLIAVLMLVAVLLATRFRGWQVWSLAGTTAVGYVLFHSAYVHHNPIYRYNWVVIPAFTLLAVVVVALAIGRPWSRTSRRGHRWWWRSAR